MNTDETLERLSVTVAAHDRQLEDILSATRNLVEVAQLHDNQIDALIRAGEQQKTQIDGLVKSLQNLERQWQAYINTLPRQ